MHKYKFKNKKGENNSDKYFAILFSRVLSMK